MILAIHTSMGPMKMIKISALKSQISNFTIIQLEEK